ncbi:MAG: hypothetical protein ACKOAM_00245 [Chakrabartia sp.]
MSKNNPNRDRRLAEALRANLRKRKDQQRETREAETPPAGPNQPT